MANLIHESEAAAAAAAATVMTTLVSRTRFVSRDISWNSQLLYEIYNDYL
jgi:hypothetical protein